MPRDGAARRRGGSQARRRHRWRAPRRARGRVSRGAPRVPRQQQERRGDRSGARCRRRRRRRRLVRRSSSDSSGSASRAAVFVRVTPGVEAHTHEYIETGTERSKFGFSVAKGDALAAVRHVVAAPGLTFGGIHCHIGSQVFRLDSCAKAAAVVVAFADECRARDRARGAGAQPRWWARRAVPRERPVDVGQRVRIGAARCGRGPDGDGRAGSRDRRRRPGSRVYRVGTIKEIRDVRDLRRGRRWHERQPPAGALRRGLRGRTSRPGSTSPARSWRRSPGSTASRAT